MLKNAQKMLFNIKYYLLNYFKIIFRFIKFKLISFLSLQIIPLLKLIDHQFFFIVIYIK